MSPGIVWRKQLECARVAGPAAPRGKRGQEQVLGQLRELQPGLGRVREGDDPEAHLLADQRVLGDLVAEIGEPLVDGRDRVPRHRVRLVADEVDRKDLADHMCDTGLRGDRRGRQRLCVVQFRNGRLCRLGWRERPRRLDGLLAGGRRLVAVRRSGARGL